MLRIVVEKEEFSKSPCTPLDYHEGKGPLGFLNSSGTLSRSFLIAGKREYTYILLVERKIIYFRNYNFYSIKTFFKNKCK